MSVAGDWAAPTGSVERATLTLGREIGAGATSTVREARKDGRLYFYKEYGKPQRHAVRLGRLIGWRDQLRPGERRFLDDHGAWPLYAVTAGDALTGFLMNPAPEEFWADMHSGRHTVELQHLLHGRNARAGGVAGPPLAERLDLLADLAELLRLLDRHSIVYGDIGPKNVLWTLHDTPRVYLIDCDNARPADLPGAASGAAMPKNGSWRDPYLRPGEWPDLNSDRYALAMFCFRVCFGSTAEVRAGDEEILVPDDAPEIPGLGELTYRGLRAPERRPSPDRWQDAIAASGRPAPGEPAGTRPIRAPSARSGPARQARPPQAARSQAARSQSARSQAPRSRPQAPARQEPMSPFIAAAVVILGLAAVVLVVLLLTHRL